MQQSGGWKTVRSFSLVKFVLITLAMGFGSEWIAESLGEPVTPLIRMTFLGLAFFLSMSKRRIPPPRTRKPKIEEMTPAQEPSEGVQTISTEVGPLSGFVSKVAPIVPASNNRLSGKALWDSIPDAIEINEDFSGEVVITHRGTGDSNSIIHISTQQLDKTAGSGTR